MLVGRERADEEADAEGSNADESDSYICGMWRQSPVRYMGKVVAWWQCCGAGCDRSQSL
jgi:hypothetical protein